MLALKAPQTYWAKGRLLGALCLGLKLGLGLLGLTTLKVSMLRSFLGSSCACVKQRGKGPLCRRRSGMPCLEQSCGQVRFHACREPLFSLDPVNPETWRNSYAQLNSAAAERSFCPAQSFRAQRTQSTRSKLRRGLVGFRIIAWGVARLLTHALLKQSCFWCFCCRDQDLRRILRRPCWRSASHLLGLPARASESSCFRQTTT